MGLITLYTWYVPVYVQQYCIAVMYVSSNTVYHVCAKKPLLQYIPPFVLLSRIFLPYYHTMLVCIYHLSHQHLGHRNINCYSE